jgi:hypothetical protein
VSVVYKNKMPIINRGSRAYYYKSQRIGGRVVNTLVASGPLAEVMAEQSRTERSRRSVAAAEARERRADRRVARSKRAEIEESDRPTIAAVSLALEIAGEAMIAAGYRKRRGEWRKPRRPGMCEFSEIVGPEPRAEVKIRDGKATFAVTGLDSDDPAAVRLAYREHLQRAGEFDAAEQPAVNRAYAQAARHDVLVAEGQIQGSGNRVANMIERLGGNPVGRAEAALIRRLSEGQHRGLYTIRALELRLHEFKRDLLGGDPTAIERVLVDSIGCAWLASMQAEEAAAQWRGSPELRDYLDRRVERANRRLNSGLKTLALVRRKIPGVAVQVNLAMAGSPRDGAIGSDGPARQIGTARDGRGPHQDDRPIGG